MTFDIGAISHATAMAAFLLLMLLVVLSWRQGYIGAWLTAACGLTALWAGVAAWNDWTGGQLGLAVLVLEVLRTAGWIAFLLSLLFLDRQGGTMAPAWLATVGAIGALCAAVVGLDIAAAAHVGADMLAGALNLPIFGRLILAVAGLLLVENLLRNTRPEHRWGIKFLCFGIGGLFAYDFFMYADALLFHRVNDNLGAARGVTNALIVPLIAVSARRNPTWSIDVFVSRQVIFHSTTLVGAGVYLLAMAGVGYYLREFGGEWGSVLQATFLFAALILMALVLFSGTFRARLKEMISTHFFSYKYDYRDEWLRFIGTISSSTGAGVSLPMRVMEGIAGIVESPEGAIWFCEDETRCTLMASWNATVPEGAMEVDPSFTEFLESRQAVINLAQLEERPDAYDGLIVPDWLREIRRAWLIVPLIHHDRLLGFLLLGQPRAARDVDHEDYVLLTTVGRQAASYLAERETARALVEARQFDEFNRRFAFVLHDIKNLVSQLSLLTQNAEKHKKNPAFQEDMLATVKESVDKMNRLLVRLHEGGREAAATKAVELAPLMRGAVERNAGRNDNLMFESTVDGISVVADEERLCAVLAHLIDNALGGISEMTDGTGRVDVRLSARGGEAVIEVQDNGAGMDEHFVRNELFRPFKSTKSGGYGIGAFESREFVRELGGRMDVISAPGKGTTIRISVPALNASQENELARQTLASH
ncbi:MAG: PEP-CTERM system histidine kinase PrsK [Alphaproteobacteria bacterium]|nr:PEP-CTERM system histidine kinase PrsK [Alphaproteobacteria bacterium]